MAQIPSGISMSAAQAGYQARSVADVDNAQRSAASGGASSGPKGIEGASEVVETSDQDMEVFVDAEGSGSQGRPFEEPPEEEKKHDEGVTQDADGQVHLDIQA